MHPFSLGMRRHGSKSPGPKKSGVFHSDACVAECASVLWAALYLLTCYDPRQVVKGIAGDFEDMAYLQLRPDKVEETALALASRIRERFPEAGLADMCDHLADLAKDADQTGRELQRPIVPLRAALGVASIFLGLVVLYALWTSLPALLQRESIAAQVTTLDSLVQLLIPVGIVVLSLWTIERRMKRKRALRAIHRLREVAHVIDMHQLTKDPSLFAAKAGPTKSSPQRNLDLNDTVRYLNYCTEMLAIVGKVAAIYTQRFDDPVALASAAEIEELSTGLSSKIWQKIMIAEDIADCES